MPLIGLPRGAMTALPQSKPGKRCNSRVLARTVVIESSLRRGQPQVGPGPRIASSQVARFCRHVQDAELSKRHICS